MKYFIIAIIFFCSCSNEAIIEKNILTNDTENFYFSIVNNSNSNSKFSFSLNNKFYESESDIKKEINKMSEKTNDSLFYYAWKFVCNNTYSYSSLIKQNWSTTPLLYLNSFGVGLCGKQANVLSNIWQMLGYKTRIWNLNGHIVPEVQYKGRWNMLDPAYKVYYYNKYNKIANVEELMKDPTLITNPKKVNINDYYYYIRCTDKYAKLISTRNDNFVINDKTNQNILNNFFITLPPKSILEFPGIFCKKATTINSTELPYYSNCRIKIPPNWVGVVSNTLLLADIQGIGTVKINNEEFKINSANLSKKISTHKKFIYEVEILNHEDTISLIYFINPIFSEIRKNNTLRIKGENIETIQFKHIYLPDSLSVLKRLRNQYFCYEKERIKLFYKNSIKNFVITNNYKIETFEEFYYYLNEYCEKQNLSDKNKMIIIERIKHIFNKIPKNSNYKYFFEALNHIPRELIFYDIINSSDNSFYLVLLNLTKN